MHAQAKRPSLGANSVLRWPLMSKHLDSVEPASILELGPGTGNLAAHLASRARYVGVEPDETSRAIAAAKVSKAGSSARLVADIDELRAEEQFDLICAFEVLEHIEDDAGSLALWARHLRPGGHVLVSVPADPHRYGPWDELVGHVRRYTREELAKAFEAAGLDPVEVTYYGFPAGMVLDLGYNWLARRRLARASTPTDLAGRTAQSARNVELPRWVRTVTWYGMGPFRLLQARFPDRGVGLVGLAQAPN